MLILVSTVDHWSNNALLLSLLLTLLSFRFTALVLFSLMCIVEIISFHYVLKQMLTSLDQKEDSKEKILGFVILSQYRCIEL